MRAVHVLAGAKPGPHRATAPTNLVATLAITSLLGPNPGPHRACYLIGLDERVYESAPGPNSALIERASAISAPSCLRPLPGTGPGPHRGYLIGDRKALSMARSLPGPSPGPHRAVRIQRIEVEYRPFLAGPNPALIERSSATAVTSSATPVLAGDRPRPSSSG